MSLLQKISKPRIVDFLRLSDRERWCSPRIRYASIRSKGELVSDILENFAFTQESNRIKIIPRRKIPHFPDLTYCLESRHFLLGGQVFDSARVSRQKPQFQIDRGKITLLFGARTLVQRDKNTTFACAVASP